MSAAIEAGMEGIPSIGFSLLDYNWEADFSQIESFIKTISNQVLTQGLQKGIILNVNFPKTIKKTILRAFASVVKPMLIGLKNLTNVKPR